MDNDILFQPLRFRNLTVKNKLLRSSISGRIDNYDGSGTPARINWEAKFARGGVGAIISAHVPVHVRGRILPNYATIDRDERVKFWRMLIERVHAFDCKFILQLSHAGHQQDIGGVENEGKKPLSSTSKLDWFHGFPSQAMSIEEIRETVGLFAAGARRAREAGADGIELHACNGYLFTQFLSPAINDRKDEYGGSLENRARFLLEVMRAIRKEVGRDFHMQVKISAIDRNDAVEPWLPAGTTLEDSLQVARWVEAEGADALHVSTGSYFPHPWNPPGKFPLAAATETYDTMISSGYYGLRNYLAFRYLRPLVHLAWYRTTKGRAEEAISLEEARAIKAVVAIPVISTGGYQHASVIRAAIEGGGCDAVSIARPLMANYNLPQIWQSGKDTADRPCTYCNKCLLNVLENPLGCYDEARFESHDEMIREVMSFYEEGDWELQPAPR
jgi:2,4-dienoyl-CoA reductase-like NADH-dependent reductase (Old Yellow Enzyme family)